MGDLLGNGIEVTENIEAFWQAGLEKNWRRAESLVPAVRSEIPAENPFREYWLLSQMVQYLVHAGQPNLARAKINELSAAEIALFGNNIEALSQLGQLSVWLDEPDAAISHQLSGKGPWCCARLVASEFLSDPAEQYRRDAPCCWLEGACSDRSHGGPS